MKRMGPIGATITVAAVLALVLGAAFVARDARVAGPVHAVATGLVPPDLTDPGMIRRGAVHYDLVCATCHASPLEPARGDALDLSPPAPRLHQRADDWPESLMFEVVRDGIDGSAMPAWPAPDRTDEIWAMVAFLKVLPDLSSNAYATLAGRDLSPDPAAPEIPERLDRTCARCHAAPDGAAPRLGIQSAPYLEDALRAYRTGARASGFMQHLATRLSDADIAALAQWQARAARNVEDAEPRDAPAIVMQGAPERQIAACSACHGITTPARPAFPSLAGQHADYLAVQLAHFADDAPHHPAHRGGGPFVGLMQQAAEGLTDDEIRSIAEWYAGLPTDR